MTHISKIQEIATKSWRAGNCVAMANSDENKQALAKYTELVNDHYEEPVRENFWDYTNHICAGIRVDNNSDNIVQMNLILVNNDYSSIIVMSLQYLINFSVHKI